MITHKCHRMSHFLGFALQICIDNKVQGMYLMYPHFSNTSYYTNIQLNIAPLIGAFSYLNINTQIS